MHEAAVAYHWLVAQGFWRAVVGVVVATLTGWLLRLGKRLRKIENHLDTSTPGGLAEVVGELRRSRGEDPSP